MKDIVVYTARRIHTMNPAMPDATAVAVRGGMIIEVGDLESMSPWLDAYPHRIDNTFADQILTPGFIDPHLHPTLCAVLLPTNFITAMEWRMPWGVAKAVRGHDDYMHRLVSIHQSMEDETEPLLTWGYHRIWHGEMSRAILDEVSTERPIIIWQRSYHEMFLNSAAIRWLELDEKEVDKHHQVDIKQGRFFEMGKSVLLHSLNPFLLEPKRFAHGLERMKDAVHFGGHTTIGDMAFGISDAEMEWEQLTKSIERDDTPFRVALVPRAQPDQDPAEQMDRFQRLKERNTHRMTFDNSIKLFADGGFFAELMQVQKPGFIDGHEGEWMTAPETLESLAREAWNRGLRIHVHCTGDMGLELALDILAKLQWERPRFDHRFTIEHFGMSSPEQCERIAALGAQVSANVYYVHELAEAYWQHSLGMERASQMVRLGSCRRSGVRVALHSDLTMAPAIPLNSVWVAVNRISESGEIMCEGERLTVDEAMRAITIDAAYMLGMENEIGSIRAGKRADFTVLDQDPYEVPEMEIKDIPVWGVVFEGLPHPYKSS